MSRLIDLTGRRSAIKSCGCIGNRTHGCSDTSEYQTWAAMWQRCTNPKDKKFHCYGGRGISVCESWRSFANFLADMGKRPTGLTLDRINNDGNYEPTNCWRASYKQQANNQRHLEHGTDGRFIRSIS